MTAALAGCATDISAHLVILHNTREHDNGAAVSLVDHLPKVPASVLQRALCDNESFLLLVALPQQREEMTSKLTQLHRGRLLLTLTKLALM